MAIDLRSDTVTQPVPGMRQAMMDAAVGDDVFGDDPTILQLQRRIATLLDKEAALFTPTGTMANQLALRAQTQPGDEVLVDSFSHIFSWESGAGAVYSEIYGTFTIITNDSPVRRHTVARESDKHPRYR